MHIDAILSAIAGSGVSAFLAKAYIGKSLRDLEQVAEKVSEIVARLSAISVRLENTEKAVDLVAKHDRKIAILETELYGPGIKRRSSVSSE